MRLILIGFMLAAIPGSLASAADQAIVSKRVIYPGQTIDPQNLNAVVLRKRPIIRYQFVTQVEQIAGLVAAKTILPGRFIPVTSARPPSVVKSGSPIWVTLQSGGLVIRLQCIALTHGGVGDQVTLRNVSSGKIFIGTVKPDGLVVASNL